MHTTNPELRCKMLHNRFAGEVLRYLNRLYENQIEMNGQIVLCKGVNDGEELKRTIEDLSGFLPFMRSVSVVPAGITKYRENLYPLELFSKEEARDVIHCVEKYQTVFYEQYGLHFIHASDEFYLLAQYEMPEEARYDGYIQLENGVGMLRLLQDEFHEALQERINRKLYEKEKKEKTHTVTIATGKLAYPILHKLADDLMVAYENLTIHVVCIRNDFFGETITVSGLITGQDLIQQIQQWKKTKKSWGDLLISSNMLRMGEEVFLDDVTLDQVRQALGMNVYPVDSNGKTLLEAMLDCNYVMPERQEGFVYVKAFPEED